MKSSSARNCIDRRRRSSVLLTSALIVSKGLASVSRAPVRGRTCFTNSTSSRAAKSTACALPGGHIYITTGLLKIANDNELASVLGHEVGHIAARHSLKTLKKRQEYNAFAKSIGELTGVAGDIGRDLGVTSQLKCSAKAF